MSPQAGPLTWSTGAVVAATGKASAAVATIRKASSRKCCISVPFSGELEIGRPGASVCKRQEQDVATCARGRLPVVDVLSGGRVVAERRAAGRRRLEGVVGCGAARRATEPGTHDRAEIDNCGAALRQRPLDGIGLPRFADVERRGIVDRLQEAG